MMKKLIFILTIFASFQSFAQTPSGNKIRYQGSWYLCKDTATLTSADTASITYQCRDSSFYYKAQGYWRKFAVVTGAGFVQVSDTASMLAGYKTYYPRTALSFVAGSGAYNSTTGVITIPTNNSQIANGAGYITSNQAVTVTATGDATGVSTSSGTAPSLPLVVGKINGTSLAGLTTGILKNTTTTGVPSIAIAADFPTLNQNTTGSAATLTTARTISGTGEATFITPAFDGSAPVSGSVTLTNGAVIAKVLTSYVSGAGIVTATDNILQAIQKLNGNVGALVTGVSSFNSRTGAVIPVAGDYSALTETLTNKSISESQITNLSTDLASKANLSGATFTGNVILNADPTLALGAATKNYVDNAITGIYWKTAVKEATTANIVLSGTQTIDGIAAVAGDRVLVKNQTAATTNGLYTVSAGAWPRTTDANTGTLIWASAVYVTSGGTLNGGTQWTNSNTTLPTIGTDNITFSQIAGAGVYTNGTYLSLTGNIFDVGSTYSANWNTAYTNRITSLTTTGSGVATLAANVLNIPTYTLPTATNLVLGGVKPDGTSILNTAGVISVTPTSVGSPSGSGSSTGTNTGDNATNTNYASDYRAANFVAGTNYEVPLTFSTGLNRTGNTITSTITQYTDALARAAHSFVAGSGAYNSLTGVITIPTNNSQIANGAGYLTTAVTSVGGAGTVSGLTLSGTVTTTGNLTLGGTLAVTASNFASQVSNTFLSAPTGIAGVPTFRTIVAADIPTLNQNTTGTAASLSAILASTLGGSGVNNAGTLTWGAGGTLGTNAFNSTGYLPLSGGTLTGALNGTSASFTYADASYNAGITVKNTTNSTGAQSRINISNSDNNFLALIKNPSAASSGSALIATSSTEDLVLGVNYQDNIHIYNGGNIGLSTTSNAGYKLDVNGTGRFSGLLTLNRDNSLITGSPLTNTNSTQFNLTSFGANLSVGIDNSTGTYMLSSGGASYASIISTNNATPLILGTNLTARFTIASTGAATFSSSVTATSFIGNVTGTAAGETLATVTGRGASTSTAVSFNGGLSATTGGFSGKVYAQGTGTTTGFTLAHTLIYEDASLGFNITNPGSFPTVAFSINVSGNTLIGTTTDNGSKFQVAGAATFSTGINITGNGGFFNSANKFGVDNNLGASRLYTSGPDVSTKGSFEFHTNNSSGSLDVIALGISNTGAATFSSSITATQFIPTGGSGTGPRISYQSNGLYLQGGSDGLWVNNTANSVNILHLTDAGNLTVNGGTGSITAGSGAFTTGTFSGNSVTLGGNTNGNTQLTINSSSATAQRISFQVAGVDQWLIGNGAASQNTNFELYNTLGTVVYSVNRTTNASTFSSTVTASSFIKSAGTSSQYLMADGSVTTANTISGVALGGTLATLTFGTHMTGTSYNGSTAATIATDATTAATASTIAARDASGNITAVGFFESSDARLKNVISRNNDMVIFKWKPELKRDTKLHYGYLAQEVQKIMPDAVKKDNDDNFSVDYIQILVKKINDLENRIKKLENK